jgi:hypothetical protein
MDRGWFYDGTECFLIVDALFLTETTDNPSCFLADEGSIRIVLMAKHPFATDNISAWWWENETPCVVGEESVKLLAHSLRPVWIMTSGAIGFGNRGDGRLGGKIQMFPGQMKTRLGPCAHRVRI